MNSHLKLRRLQAVLAVHDHGSALKAADNIHMSQPSVTDAIAACEADIGTALFTRTARGMVPTSAGVTFCKRIALAFEHLQQAETLIRQKRGKATAPLHRLVSEVQLKALSAVVEAGGFHQAARRIGLSQPSVHRAARELETLCGVPLFRRDGAGVEATAEARALARFADLCFGELSSGLAEVRELQGVVDGQLAVGALPLARSQWLPEAVAATLRDFPLAKVRIMDGPYDEQLRALLHGRIDMILGALRDPSPTPDITQEAVFSDPVVIVVRADHPFAAGFDSERDKLTADQLDDLAWVLPRDGTPGRRNFEAFMRTKGLDSPARVVECSSLVTTRALVLQSDHAALLSRQQVEAELTQGRLKIMGPPLSGSLRAIGIATRASFRPTHLQDRFLRHLRANAPAALAT